MAYRQDETLKLTRRLMMSLPEGLYLASGTCDDQGCPVYEGVVARAGVRDMQWEKIKHCRADQRHCFVFDSKQEYVRWHERIEGLGLNGWALGDHEDRSQ